MSVGKVEPFRGADHREFVEVPTSPKQVVPAGEGIREGREAMRVGEVTAIDAVGGAEGSPHLFIEVRMTEPFEIFLADGTKDVVT